jgi:hypothetical protein
MATLDAPTVLRALALLSSSLSSFAFLSSSASASSRHTERVLLLA